MKLKELRQIIREEAEKNTSFAQAMKSIHPVETQWHYPKLTKYGFIPDTKSAVGMVRTYKYHHPETGEIITASTGANSDHWESDQYKFTRGKEGEWFWGGLEPYLKTKYEAI